MPLEYLHPHHSSENGSYHHVKALQRGRTSISSLLKAVRVSLYSVVGLGLMFQPLDLDALKQSELEHTVLGSLAGDSSTCVK